MTNVVLTFNELNAGDIVDNQFRADGVTVRSANPDNAPMIFDTANPTGGDTDLASDDRGNVLILSQDNNSLDPNDNAGGGTLIFEFDAPTDVTSLRAFDTERGGTVRLFDEAGTLITEIELPNTEDGEQADVLLDVSGVARMDVQIDGSGAIDDISFDRPVALDGLVEGTDGDDLIDLAYTGDPDGDRVDAGDAILPQEGAQDDIIDALGGNDQINAGAGADEIYAGGGDDTVTGGARGDVIYGDSNLPGGPGDSDADGDDMLFGRGGADQIFGEGGDDLLSGGSGSDTLTGGAGADDIRGDAGRDVIIGGNDGDVVDGGGTGNDTDTLDLRGLGAFRVVNEVVDGNGNGTNGTVEFLDDDGSVVGTLVFTEIELILGDRVNAGPDAVDDTANTDEDESIVIDVLFNDTGGDDGDALTIVSAVAQNGTVTVNDDGTLTYVPNPDFNGDDTVTYDITDGDGAFDTATVQLTIEAINDAPDARNDSQTTPVNTATTIAVLSNDVDVEGDQLTISEATSSDGTVAVNEDGTITFTPDTGFEGEAQVSYTISDSDGATDTASVSILVQAETLDGIVAGTDGDDVIDLNYTGDPEGDRIDNNDAILSGEAPNDDVIEAGAGDDNITAGAGDDVVDAGPGDDVVQGEGGNDTITTGDGNDSVSGGEGDDVIDTSSGDTPPRPDLGFPGLFAGDEDPDNDIDLVDGGAGDDIISTGDDSDTIIGGAGDDQIDGGIDDDIITGDAGADRIVGGEGADMIDGGDGDDTIFAGIDPELGFPDDLDIADDDGDLVTNNGTDIVSGGAGNDTIFGADDDDELSGDEGDDFIDGGLDDDTILGGTGNDTIIGGQGADEQFGGDDRDTFNVTSAADGDGDVIDGGAGGDDVDTLDLTGSGPVRITLTSEDGEDGFVEFLDGQDGPVTGTLDFTEIENIVPCFTPGTSIATLKGEIAVEDLQVGDRVITRDNGIQTVRWLGAKQFQAYELQSEAHLCPVLIQQDALGNGLPERDMLVSPNHRMLVNNDRVSLYFDEREVLVSAKHLINPREGVKTVSSTGITYIHVMFDNHEVILANGAWSESFQPGDYSLKGIGNAQRNEIFELFPELKGDKGREAYSSARLTLKKHEARLLFK